MPDDYKSVPFETVSKGFLVATEELAQLRSELATLQREKADLLAACKKAESRVAVINRCLKEAVVPRLIEDYKPKNDKERAMLRVTLNFVLNLIEGNESFAKEVNERAGG
jgi:hypothetical protein